MNTPSFNLPKAHRTIALKEIKILASVGILPHEQEAKQMIYIDAFVHMGAQNLIPEHDGVDSVLDYRKIYQIVQEEVERQHTNMLETLAGKLCERLLRLQGVLGARICVTKPDIFPNCSVSVELDAGCWERT